MHAEPEAMQKIVEALAGLTTPQRQSVARKIRLTGDAEIGAMKRVLAALENVQGAPARTRVIDWAMSAYQAPKQTRKPKRDDKPQPADKTIDLRAVPSQ